jgi:hypothetical protein
MNLHAVVGPLVGAVNPFQPATIQVSAGYATSTGGARTPQYQTFAGVTVQVQELSTADLRQLDALNVQGSTRKVYVSGEVDAILRFAQKGGDLVILSDGTVWQTTAVMERWPDWCCIAATLQNGS